MFLNKSKNLKVYTNILSFHKARIKSTYTIIYSSKYKLLFYILAINKKW